MSRRTVRRVHRLIAALAVLALLPAGSTQVAAAVPALPPLPGVAPEVLRGALAEIYADYYSMDTAVVERLMRAGIADDDVSVIALVGNVSTSPTSALALMRIQKVPWADVFARLAVPGRVLLPTLQARRPAGRYAQAVAVITADPEAPARLSDNQVRDLVQLKLAVEYFALDPGLVTAWRDGGIPNARILLAQYYAGGRRPTGRKVQLVGPAASAASLP